MQLPTTTMGNANATAVHAHTERYVYTARPKIRTKNADVIVSTTTTTSRSDRDEQMCGVFHPLNSNSAVQHRIDILLYVELFACWPLCGKRKRHTQFQLYGARRNEKERAQHSPGENERSERNSEEEKKPNARQLMDWYGISNNCQTIYFLTHTLKDALRTYKTHDDNNNDDDEVESRKRRVCIS